MKCPNCQAENTVGTLYCGQCLEPLPVETLGTLGTAGSPASVPSNVASVPGAIYDAAHDSYPVPPAPQPPPPPPMAAPPSSPDPISIGAPVSRYPDPHEENTTIIPAVSFPPSEHNSAPSPTDQTHGNLGSYAATDSFQDSDGQTHGSLNAQESMSAPAQPPLTETPENISAPSSGAGEVGSHASSGGALATGKGASSPQAKLIVTRGGKIGQEYRLNPGENEIGRWDDEEGFEPHIDLTDQDVEGFISRRHAHVRFENNEWTVIDDPRSSNGVKFRGAKDKLDKNVPYPLHDGDELVMGRVIMKFVTE